MIRELVSSAWVHSGVNFTTSSLLLLLFIEQDPLLGTSTNELLCGFGQSVVTRSPASRKLTMSVTKLTTDIDINNALSVRRSSQFSYGSFLWVSTSHFCPNALLPHVAGTSGVIPFKLNYMWGPLPLPLEESERHTGGGKYYQRVVVVGLQGQRKGCTERVPRWCSWTMVGKIPG